MTDPTAVSECVLGTFYNLPAKFKPRTLADGRREWVPLAGIVLSRGVLPATYIASLRADGTPVEKTVLRPA